MIALLISVLCATALAALPQPVTRRVNIFLAENVMAARSAHTVMIPELLNKGLTVEIDKYTGVEYKLCMKANVAAPVMAGMANWATPGYCELFHFTNKTQAANVVGGLHKRAVASYLRGVGHSRRQRSVMGGAAAAKTATMNDEEEAAAPARAGYVALASGNGGVMTKNIASGDYWLTIAAVKKQTKNVTLSLKLTGMTCGAGMYVAANGQCAAFGKFNGARQFKNVMPFDSVTNDVTPAAKIGVETGALTLMANIVGGVDTSSAQVLLRHNAPPVPGENATFDFHLPLKGAKAGEMVITAPSTGAWYISVWNDGNSTTVDVNCTMALTQCQNQTLGAKCDTAVTKLLDVGKVSEKAETKVGEPLYFRFHRNDTAELATWLAAGDDDTEVPASLAVAVAALGKGTVKKPIVKARVGQLPTKTQFDVTGCTVGKCSDFQDSLVVPHAHVVTAKQSHDWFVVVVPQSEDGVAVWNAAGGTCAGDCNAHGTCNKKTAICECPEDYTSYDCALPASSLTYWEWVFIIGASILMAIGLVGCIIYFIQKQQRRAGFERV